jgi:O-antigen ligase
VTVAAETGIVGLLAFAGLLVAVVLALRGRLGGETVGRQTAIVACLGLAAILVHSLFYNAFFEDPFVWGFLALVVVSAQEETAAAEPSAWSSQESLEVPRSSS